MNRIQTKSSSGTGSAQSSISLGTTPCTSAPDSVVPAASRRFGTGTEDLSERKLALNVAFTSGPATIAALRRASEMAEGLGAHLRVIVPQIVPYGRQLDDPDVDTSFTVNRALEAAREAGVEADVSVVLCRDRAEGLHSALGPDGIVLIGGVSRWWHIPERVHVRTMVRRLADLGHKVLFVEGPHN